MAVALVVLTPSTPLTTTAVAYYTSPTGSSHTLIKNATFTNVTASAVTVTVYRVASGGSVGTGNIILSVLSIPANSTYVSGELRDMVLGSGDAIWALASAATSINLSMSGYTA